MDYAELKPEELLSLDFGSAQMTERAWHVAWDVGGLDAEQTGDLVLRTLPPTVDFHTSGTTGPSRCWRRLREKVWLEAGMLADFLAPQRPEAVISFVPPVHLYGALATVLVPARLGVPAWYRPTFFGSMPALPQRRVVVVATPWIFTLLLEHIEWVRRFDSVTVLYGGAMLPATAGEFLEQAGSDRALVVEVLGSTEAGGIASRRFRTGEPPAWTLFPDVEFAAPPAGPASAAPPAGPASAAPPAGPASAEHAGAGEPTTVDNRTAGGLSAEEDEVPLVIRSPRLAFRPGEQTPLQWESDDYVQPLDERTFRFAGRRNRLVKVNGRRINLDEVEHQLRAVLNCADLAVVPVADRMIGEHVDLLVVLKPDTTLADVDLAAGYARMGVRPRRVRVVPTIDRSALGKLRHVQSSTSEDAEVAR